MRGSISFCENGIYLVIEISDENECRLLHLSSVPYDDGIIEEDSKKWYKPVEIHISGENIDDNHGHKYTGGLKLTYDSHRDYRNEYGRKIEITLKGAGLSAVYHLQFYDNIKAVRSWTEVRNIGNEQVGLEYVSSFTLAGVSKEGMLPWDKKCMLHIPHNTWCGEAQWKENSLPELGLSMVNGSSVKRVSLSSTGTWPACEFLPMGCLENMESGITYIWQIEHNGSWQWEISDKSKQLYVELSGPNERESGWWKKLKPKDTFITVPVSIAVVNGGFDEAVGEMTKYRRALRRPNDDDKKLPVIFNDFMNCLSGDPTTEKLIPLIDAAADAGCEYFCIDCGWYADGGWWDNVGEWLPSKKRFPGGIKEPLDYIRSKGMIPGLWLEIEVMGIKCPLAKRLPDSWFFMRHGRRVIDHGRYQLDFRNPDVRKYADSVIDRLVKEYGAGYIKMDYNIDAGAGTEVDADSFGDGLLEHNRAYLEWLKGVFERYPGLVVENCSSGGMRMEYAHLMLHSIQSCTDQTDYKKMAAIAASCPTALTPEQAAIWSYPLKDGDEEEVVFNMVNAMLMRIHQSGHLAELSSGRFALVKEGIQTYKRIRDDIKTGFPFWPLGHPSFDSEWISLGLKCGGRVYLAIWKMDAKDEFCMVPLSFLKGEASKVECIYPSENEYGFKWNSESGVLSVDIPDNYRARLFKIEVRE